MSSPRNDWETTKFSLTLKFNKHSGVHHHKFQWAWLLGKLWSDSVSVLDNSVNHQGQEQTHSDNILKYCETSQKASTSCWNGGEELIWVVNTGTYSPFAVETEISCRSSDNDRHPFSITKTVWNVLLASVFLSTWCQHTHTESKLQEFSKSSADHQWKGQCVSGQSPFPFSLLTF